MSSNRQPEDNDNLLKSIAATVELMRDRMATKDDLERFAAKGDLERFAAKGDLERFATKDDLQRFATREDFERFATREDLERFATKEDLDRFATKEEFERFATKEEFDSLREQVAFLGGQVEDVRDRMATKDDIGRLDSRLDKIEVKVDRVEVTTAVIKGEVEQVHLRLDGIDRALTLRLDHVEAEMSRMRSVLYLLVKDRPDMLRLLGQAPPSDG
jgi:tetrahydromethanopterin S-methyltransferase subunit G